MTGGGVNGRPHPKAGQWQSKKVPPVGSGGYNSGTGDGGASRNGSGHGCLITGIALLGSPWLTSLLLAASEVVA